MYDPKVENCPLKTWYIAARDQQRRSTVAASTAFLIPLLL
jgi:hypothetical protein